MSTELMKFKESYLKLEAELHKDKLMQLIEKSMNVRYNAHAPYSRFLVGAALLTADGKIYTGVNIENSSFPVGLCAERAAFAAALTKGERCFTAIAIIGGESGLELDYCMPCGMCLQFMSEFCGRNMKVISVKSATDYRIFRLDELLPYGFRLH